MGVKVGWCRTEWASGTHEQIKEYLDSFDWSDAMLLCHNTMFDGAILNWRLEYVQVYADTMCIARAIHGVETSASLKAVSEKYGIGQKGTEVVQALGKRREGFTPAELSRYGDYCVNDVDLTYKLFTIMAKDFPARN